ncbi:PQQ-dependent sugar dehydrogenase [Myxococcota bacterium]|nr:PQQ-dependent sugar dehydrogenase [Myxococcota bacterium]
MAKRPTSRFLLAPAAWLILGWGVIAVSCHTPLQPDPSARTPEKVAPAEESQVADTGPSDAEMMEDSRDAWVAPDEMGGIYEAQCAVCHGAGMEGTAQGPSLLIEPLVHGQSVDGLVESIAKGFPDRGMPGWSQVLDPDDIRGLSIYLLEQRAIDTGEAGLGIGEPPEVPSQPIEGELHRFVLRPVFGGLSEPYSIAPLPDGRILVAEKMLGLRIVAADGKTSTRVTGTPRFYTDSVIRGTTLAGNGWAHEAALHPAYSENGWIYLSYGDRCQDCNEASRESGRPVSMLKLVRGRLDGSRWVDQETIWEAPKDTYQDGLENGAGARIAFDDQGYVYLSFGELTDYRGIQDLGLPYGKIHRMHDDGRTPVDNPWVDEPGAMKSAFTLGHRNPQGLAFDHSTGRLWESEHGPRGGDEANLIRSGLNYGWPLVSLGVDYDGRPIRYAEKYGIEFDPADLEPTTVDWTPSPGVSSIVFYRGEAFPRWQNHMLVATLKQNELWRVVIDESGAQHTEVLIRGLGRFRDVEVDPQGDVLVLLEHRAGSQIVRLEPTGP